MSTSALIHAKNLLSFIDKSPTPYHAVETVKSQLTSKGFRELYDGDEWNIKKNDLVFVTKNYSTVIALAIGGKFEAGNGISIVGAHTDSPCVKLKPKSDQTGDYYTKMGVETYGGGIWHTWFDRDLTIAGRCIIREENCCRHKLINLEKPIARIPTLAIHLDRTTNDGFSPNKETHLCPVLSTSNKGENIPSNNNLKHPNALLNKIAESLLVNVNDIIDMDLYFADVQPSVLGGINEEFIFAPRLDNLFNCFASIQALVDSLESLSNDTNIRAVCLYDNEEVGSESAQGAMSAFTELVLRRVVNTLQTGQYERSIANSLLVSADQAHAVHPNYSDKHEYQHRPTLHGGVVLKINSNQRYASTAVTQAILREIANKCNVPLQEFVIRQDMACGSTIGPLMAAKMGISTVDVGSPQLSMHSCREMTDISSPLQAIQLFTAFFEHYPEISRRFRAGRD